MQAVRLGDVLRFLLKLAIAAPLCLVGWWQAAPAYAWGLGIVSAAILKYGLGYPIEAVVVRPAGLMNTETTLGFVLEGRGPTLPVIQLVSNVATFVALMIATGGIGLRRRLVVAGAGLALLALCHVAYLVLAFTFASTIARHPQVPTAVAQVFITLPLLLWIAMAYWGRASAILMGNASSTPRDSHRPGS